ncbi:MAG: hypothetical protein HGA49_01135 [Eubacteriaceae bacterium]|nr:hypothetical protein [Eubacteriaceae bacterium]
MKKEKSRNSSREKVIAIIFIMALFLLAAGSTAKFSSTLRTNLSNIAIEYKKELSADAKPGDRIKGMINKFDSLYNDKILYVDKISGIDSSLRFFITGEFVSKQVLLGKQNWLFYKSEFDGNPIADYQGTDHMTLKQLENTKDCLADIKKIMESRGIRFVLMVPPNKEQVYKMYMPENIEIINDKSRTDVLIEYLNNNTNIDIVDPKAELIQVSEGYQTYYKYDSHWNQLGSYVGEQQLLEVLYGKRSYLEKQKILKFQLKEHENGDNGLANMVGMKWYFNDDAEYIVEDSIHDLDNWTVKNYSNEKAPHQESVLFIGDSFSTAMKPHLFHDFSEVNIIHTKEYYPEMLDLYKPDIIVLEFVERYSGNLSSFEIAK